MDIKVLITEEEITSRTRELAHQIQKDYNNEEIVIVCILKGAAFFATELAKRIDSDTIIDFMKVSSYIGTESTGKIDFTFYLNNIILPEAIYTVILSIFLYAGMNHIDQRLTTYERKRERRLG